MIIISALLPSFAVYGQEQLTYSNVIEVDSTLDKSELYINKKIWFSETQHVIEMDDKESNTIIGMANMKYSSNFLSGSDATRGRICYTVKIRFKDGTYKYHTLFRTAQV